MNSGAQSAPHPEVMLAEKIKSAEPKKPIRKLTKLPPNSRQAKSSVTQIKM